MAQEKPRRGCLFHASLSIALLIVVILLGLFLGFWAGVWSSTAAAPADLPSSRLSAEEFGRLQDRIAAFDRNVNQRRATEPLKLNADEVNALIQHDTNWAFLKGQIYVALETNRLKAQLSVPIERLGGSSRLHGRYLNGSGSFQVSLAGNVLLVRPESPEAIFIKGKPASRSVQRQIGDRNFALTFTNATVNSALAKLIAVEIKDGQLVIVPKSNP